MLAQGLAARIRKLNTRAICHAMGMAEYHGPRSQMMRVIDNITILKEGFGCGAMAGVSAAALAKEEFIGSPAKRVGAEEQETYFLIWVNAGPHWSNILCFGHLLQPCSPAQNVVASTI